MEGATIADVQCFFGDVFDNFSLILGVRGVILEVPGLTFRGPGGTLGALRSQGWFWDDFGEVWGYLWGTIFEFFRKKIGPA